MTVTPDNLIELESKSNNEFDPLSNQELNQTNVDLNLTDYYNLDPILLVKIINNLTRQYSQLWDENRLVLKEKDSLYLEIKSLVTNYERITEETNSNLNKMKADIEELTREIKHLRKSLTFEVGIPAGMLEDDNDLVMD